MKKEIRKYLTKISNLIDRILGIERDYIFYNLIPIRIKNNFSNDRVS